MTFYCSSSKEFPWLEIHRCLVQAVYFYTCFSSTIAQRKLTSNSFIHHVSFSVK